MVWVLLTYKLNHQTSTVTCAQSHMWEMGIGTCTFCSAVLLKWLSSMSFKAVRWSWNTASSSYSEGKGISPEIMTFPEDSVTCISASQATRLDFSNDLHFIRCRIQQTVFKLSLIKVTVLVLIDWLV